MQWRGGIRKRLYRVRLESMPESLPAPVSTSVEIGTITSAAIDANDNIFAIAHLPIEVVEANDSLIDSNGDSVEIIEACHA
jgi:folate-binding Fe-S cluster repair protein YgfZ